MALQEYFNTGDNDTVTMAGGTQWTSQGFKAGSSYSITSVKLKLYKSGTPGTVTVSIRTTNASYVPTGGDLTSGTTTGNDLTENTAGEWREITFGIPYTLTSGSKYAIIVRPSAGILGWRSDNIEHYVNGEGFYSFNSGGSWTTHADVEDFMFEVYGSLPVPSAPKNPTPEHEATGITLNDTVLIWEDGGGADTYDVYFRPFGEFFEKIASDITDTFTDAIVAHTVAFNGHYSYGELYLWCVIAKNEYGSNFTPPEDFGIGYGGTIWEFNAMVFEPPLPSGVTLSYAGDDDGVPTGTPTGGNLMIATRILVAAANNKIWYEDI